MEVSCLFRLKHPSANLWMKGSNQDIMDIRSTHFVNRNQFQTRMTTTLNWLLSMHYFLDLYDLAGINLEYNYFRIFKSYTYEQCQASSAAWVLGPWASDH